MEEKILEATWLCWTNGRQKEKWPKGKGVYVRAKTPASVSMLYPAWKRAPFFIIDFGFTKLEGYNLAAWQHIARGMGGEDETSTGYGGIQEPGFGRACGGADVVAAIWDEEKKGDKWVLALCSTSSCFFVWQCYLVRKSDDIIRIHWLWENERKRGESVWSTFHTTSSCLTLVWESYILQLLSMLRF